MSSPCPTEPSAAWLWEDRRILGRSGAVGYDLRMDAPITLTETNGLPGLLFGIPFTLIGVGAIGGSAWLVIAKDVPLVIMAFMVPFGAVFAGFGSFAAFHRRWLIIDCQRSTVERSWGLLVRFKRDVQPLGEWQMVGLGCERRRTSKSSYVVYPVFFTRPGDSLPIATPREYTAARQLAERVAKAAGLGVRDSASGETVTRAAGKLDESLRDRLRREGSERKMPARPPESKVQVTHDMGTLVVDVPAPGFTGFNAFFIAAAAAGLVAQTAFALLSDDFPLPFLLVGAAVMLGFAASMLLRCFTRERLSASAAALEIIRLSPLGERRAHIPSEQLEELRLGALGEDAWVGAPGIVAITDARAHCFAAGLQENEQRWLAAELRRTLAG